MFFNNLFNNLRILINLIFVRKYLFLSSIFAVSALIILKIAQVMTYVIPGNPDGKLSSIDVFLDPTGAGVYSKATFQILIVIVAALIIGVMSIQEDTCFVLRYQQKKQIWGTHVNGVFFIALVTTLIFIVFGFIGSGMVTQDFSLNWKSDGALFYFAAERVGAVHRIHGIQAQLSYFKIFLFVFIKLFLAILQSGLFIAFLKILLKTNIFVLITILGFLFIKPINSFLLFFSTLDFDYWVDNYIFIRATAFQIAFCLIIYFIGQYSIKKVEYWRERKLN